MIYVRKAPRASAFGQSETGRRSIPSTTPFDRNAGSRVAVPRKAPKLACGIRTNRKSDLVQASRGSSNPLISLCQSAERQQRKARARPEVTSTSTQPGGIGARTGSYTSRETTQSESASEPIRRCDHVAARDSSEQEQPWSRPKRTTGGRCSREKREASERAGLDGQRRMRDRRAQGR